MPELAEIPNWLCIDSEFSEKAAALRSQQIWCWGRDILRPEGNWLLEIGFERIEPPEDRSDCPSIYVLTSSGRRLILRGFGIFYADESRGGVFLPRYSFTPQYTTSNAMDCRPWADADLPPLTMPSEQQRTRCAALTLDIVEWIRDYESTVVQRLGIKYRRATLDKWNDGKQPFIPPEEFADEWRFLGLALATAIDA